MTGRAVLLVIGLSGCGFSSEPVRNNPGTGADAGTDAAVDSPAPITCGDLTCDPNATCTPAAQAACTCKPGFDGNGLTCTDIDECATDNGGCKAAACVNTPGSFTCAPKTCAEAKALKPGAPADGDYTLYVGGDLAKPWTAYCADMATTPVEYLSLTGTNSSQYSKGGDSPGSDVRTTYTKARLDPASLKIGIGDRRFATSVGMLDHSQEGMMVTSMPFGVAMDCVKPNSKTGRALIDLTGTAFALTGAAAFAEGGNMPGSSTTLSSNNQRATVTGGGFCGWNGPVDTPNDPFNNNAAGVMLPVVYLTP